MLYFSLSQNNVLFVQSIAIVPNLMMLVFIRSDFFFTLLFYQVQKSLDSVQVSNTSQKSTFLLNDIYNRRQNC